MIDDLKKSVSSILYERTTSPFFGTLLFSWSIWNWKIIYLTVFISEKSITVDKITYITTHFVNKNILITYPLISTLVFLTLIPFVSNGAYWLSLKFDKWKRDQKQLIEMKELLTLEQSIELREKINEQEKRFEKLLENKNLEIKQLNAIIESSKTEPARKTTQENKKSTSDIDQKETEELAQRIKNNNVDKTEYEKLIQYIQGGYKVTGSNGPNSNLIALMEAHYIIQNKGGGVYEFTETGKKFHRLMTK